MDVANRQADLLTTTKPSYQTPTIESYTTKKLQQQLGPARAFSPNESLDEDLFGDGF